MTSLRAIKATFERQVRFRLQPPEGGSKLHNIQPPSMDSMHAPFPRLEYYGGIVSGCQANFERKQWEHQTLQNILIVYRNDVKLTKMMDTFLIAPACTQTCCKLHAFWECYIKCVCSPQKKKNNAPEHFAGGDCESALAAERRLRSDWTFLFDSTHIHSNFAQLTPNDPKRPQNMVQG